MIAKKITFGLLAAALSGGALGHGLMSEPASRNWLCGAITKPDQAPAGSACAQAFANDSNGGYQFMSVLTHDIGRVGGRSENVCGFDSETWQGGVTPWDTPIDWPTQPMSSGLQTISWNISWGPHWDDTEEFRYWITKPDFQYQVGKALTWDDFEEEAFCVLPYDDKNPNANPNVTTEKSASLFHTQCNVPARSGRHVIYGEWGRNHYTYERFHGCIDASFGGDNSNPVVADISASPADAVFAGAGTITLSAAASTGSNLSYQWTLDATNPALYSLSSANAATTTLTLAEPQAETNVTVRLTVTSGNTTSNDAITFTHVPVAGSSWEDLGALTTTARTLAVGDQVSVRVVDENGQDTYYPSTPLTITASTAAANEWTYALAQAVNDATDAIQVGVLNTEGAVEPQQNATSNHIYAVAPSNFASAFVQIAGEDNSSSSSSSSSSFSSSSSVDAVGGQCNWYGTLHPLCETTQSGWGWEGNASCIAASTCSSQPSPYGIVGDSGESSSVPAESSSSSSSVGVSSSSSSSSVASGDGNCEYVISNEWSDGFTGAIRITNNGSSAINGWNVNWSYSDGSSVTSSWNANVSGSNPYTASNIAWNGTIQPDQSVEFGFQGTKGGSGAAQIPTLTGSVCN